MWKNNIFGMIPDTDWLDVGTVVTRPNDPIDSLFGDVKTDNLVAQWQTIAAEYRIPTMAQFHGFDTEANRAFRAPIDVHNIEKGLIKEKINQTERLRELTRTGIKDTALYDYVVRDALNLSDHVVTRTKAAKNELLSSGKVTIKENNLDLVVDYGVPEANTAFELDLSTTADIPSQLQNIVDTAADKGVILTGMVTSRKNLTKMRNNASVQKAVNGNVGAGTLVKVTALNAYLEDEYGISTVITNDLTYGVGGGIDENGRPIVTPQKYFPEDKVSFFGTNPNGKIGVGLWGDPPEVSDMLITTSTEPAVSPFVRITQWTEYDPAVLWTKASALFMPVLYNPDTLYIATVKSKAK